jgi:hypothetical protein
MAQQRFAYPIQSFIRNFWRYTVAALPIDRRVNNMCTTFIHYALDLVQTHGVAHAAAYLSYQGVTPPTVQRILFGSSEQRRMLASQDKRYAGAENRSACDVTVIQPQRVRHSFWARARAQIS